MLSGQFEDSTISELSRRTCSRSGQNGNSLIPMVLSRCGYQFARTSTELGMVTTRQSLYNGYPDINLKDNEL